MEILDEKIIVGSEKIESLLAETEKNKPEAYTYKTNLKLDGKNIRVLDILSLTEIYCDICSRIRNWKYCLKCDMDGLNSVKIEDLRYCDFPLLDWKDDILHLLKEKDYKETKKNLEEKLARIKKLHSQSFKDNAEVDDIINSLL